MESSQGIEQLTLFPRDTLANLSVMPGSEKARKMTVTSGQKLLESYRKSGPIGSLVRMLLGTYLWGSMTCYLTWKASVTTRKQLLFRLVPSVLRTEGTESSFWGTPSASDAVGSHGGGQGKSLRTDIANWKKGLWATPTASETTAKEKIELTETGRRKCLNGSSHSVDLATMVKMWPTPAAQDAKNCTLPPSQISRDTVPGAMLRDGQKGQLNPDWVECLMGFPIGWTDINGQLD
ncbi:hypothetical protein DIVA_50 [Paenibacillus phage Diva]|uniref:DNA-cytosine methyltransferase n=1 Tax=Paenibacillus phage Diva TaxID=1589750 RepID=A0A0C5AEL6_9CAUD|nr:DNA methyltransferase [Paenibacillus phage Diva]AJK27714.1 hypothetical protein DIVA_50 [Paenibacillus phage Diva]